MNADQVRQAVHDYLHRSDAETIANEPIALDLARLKLGRDFFPESAAVLVRDLPAVAGVVALPADFGQADTVTAGGRDLDYVLPRQWARSKGSADQAGKFSITGADLYVEQSVAAVDLLYYLRAEPIAGDETNWLSVDYPDVWIWMGVAEQHRFVQDFESAQIAEQYALQIATQAVLRTRSNRGGGSLRMNTRRA